jgi:hypothetical protein
VFRRSKKRRLKKTQTARVEETVYFFCWPEMVSWTDWAALPRDSWALASMPLPWFEASSPPERVESPSFWVADLSPSMKMLVDGGGQAG